MKKAISCITVILFLALIAAACSNQSIPPVAEESNATPLEESTSSYTELQSEIERLKWETQYGWCQEPHPIDIAYDKAMKEAVAFSFTGY